MHQRQNRALLRWALGALALLLAGSVANGVLAQEGKDGQVFQDWRVRCAPTQETVAAGGCFIFQSVVNNETKQPVMQIAVGLLASDKTPAAVVTLPLGVRVAPGVLLQIDENEAVRVPFERCLPDGCKIQFRLDEKQMATFKAGVGGKLAFQDGQGRNVTLPFSLKGFTAAFTAIQ